MGLKPTPSTTNMLCDYVEIIFILLSFSFLKYIGQNQLMIRGGIEIYMNACQPLHTIGT